MKTRTLNIGDVFASAEPVEYICYGLGSCIGLFIQDRVTGLSGGAHILVPEVSTVEGAAGKFLDPLSAINELLSRFRMMGSCLGFLRAKVAGGANVINVNTQTGERNADVVVTTLINNRIFIAAADTGGTSSRSVRFSSDSGKMLVRIPERNEVKIL